VSVSVNSYVVQQMAEAEAAEAASPGAWRALLRDALRRDAAGTGMLHHAIRAAWEVPGTGKEVPEPGHALAFVADDRTGGVGHPDPQWYATAAWDEFGKWTPVPYRCRTTLEPAGTDRSA
jgi:hypothetical protein